MSGWLTPTGVWSVDADGKVVDAGLTPRPPIDVSPYMTERRFATAKDGTRIPYDLIYRKGLKRDGSNPAFCPRTAVTAPPAIDLVSPAGRWR